MFVIEVCHASLGLVLEHCCMCSSMPSASGHLQHIPHLIIAGSGLSYQGQALVATAPFSPLLLANTTTKPPGPTDDNLSFPPAGAQTVAQLRLR